MTVLTRSALESSPLADLHTIAGEVGLEGFRRLRKGDLIDALLGESAPEADAEAADTGAEDDRPRRSRGRRGGRSRSRVRDEDAGDAEDDVADAAADTAVSAPSASSRDEDEPRARAPRSRSRGRRGEGENGDGGRENGRESAAASRPDGEVVTGVVEVLGNGSGFVRVAGDEPSDGDVYISAAQVRRCELVSGDRVAGPVRAPRRSERYPSLVRIDTINDAPADEVSEGTPFDDLTGAFPSVAFALGKEDPTLEAIGKLAPIGRGSRVVIAGGPRSGKSEALRRLAGVLAAIEDVELSVVLAGVRPEELKDLPEGVEAAAALAFSASVDARTQAVERALDAAKRVAARGGHAAVLIDTVDGLPEAAVRRALGAARAIVDGGTLTVVATASAPVGGETTVIALDPILAATGQIPSIDVLATGTLKAELLLSATAAKAIYTARRKAVKA